jgi:hypothetical protein
MIWLASRHCGSRCFALVRGLLFAQDAPIRADELSKRRQRPGVATELSNPRLPLSRPVCPAKPAPSSCSAIRASDRFGHALSGQFRAPASARSLGANGGPRLRRRAVARRLPWPLTDSSAMADTSVTDLICAGPAERAGSADARLAACVREALNHSCGRGPATLGPALRREWRSRVRFDDSFALLPMVTGGRHRFVRGIG